MILSSNTTLSSAKQLVVTHGLGGSRHQLWPRSEMTKSSWKGVLVVNKGVHRAVHIYVLHIVCRALRHQNVSKNSCATNIKKGEIKSGTIQLCRLDPIQVAMQRGCSWTSRSWLLCSWLNARQQPLCNVHTQGHGFILKLASELIADQPASQVHASHFQPRTSCFLNYIPTGVVKKKRMMINDKN